MKSKIRTHGFLVALVPALTIGFVATACGSSGRNDPVADDTTGQATLALTSIPADVSCVQVTVKGSRTDVRKFDVVPLQSAVLTLRGLPLGNVTFAEDAFAEACSSVGSSTIPTWVSDPVAAVLASRVVAHVRITLRRNGEAVVTSDFQDGGGTGNTPDAGVCIPVSFEVACGSRECGTVSDHCGGHYSCGSCSDPTCPMTCNASGFCAPITCLVAGTQIALADGTSLPIERVRVGDEVLAYDVATGTPRSQRVTQTFRHAAGENQEGMVLINGTVRATGNHPFYANGRWVRADTLSSGDRLIELAGTERTTGATIQSVEMLQGDEETFNLEVAGDHDYFAGGILVHNKPLPCP